MNTLLKTTLLGLLLMTAAPAFAGDPVQTTQLQKSDIKKLKMFSAHEDQIVVFVTDQNDIMYRIGSMPQAQVEKLLEHIKTNSALTLQAKKVENKSYMEVVAWN